MYQMVNMCGIHTIGNYENKKSEATPQKQENSRIKKWNCNENG